MRTKVVTSLSKPLWEKYAKECISTWLPNLKLSEGSELEIWVQGVFPIGLPRQTESGTPIKWKSLDTQSEGWKDFINTWGGYPRPDVEQGNQYRFNFQPFSCKVFALAEAAWTADNFESILWLDADTKMVQPVTDVWLQGLLKDRNVAFLDRGEPWGYGETGFILAKLWPFSDLVENEENPLVALFTEQAKIYSSGQLFFFREWHDAFIFTSIVRRMERLDDRVKPINLNKDMKSEFKGGRYPFETSPLKDYIVHLKGPLKENVGPT